MADIVTSANATVWSANTSWVGNATPGISDYATITYPITLDVNATIKGINSANSTSYIRQSGSYKISVANGGLQYTISGLSI